VAAFGEWARISRGAFSPSNVREEWQGEDEDDPVIISFEMGGRTHRVEGKNLGDYFDLEILAQLDELIRPSGIQFAAHDTGDQTAYFVCLTDEERKAILKGRGVKFDW